MNIKPKTKNIPTVKRFEDPEIWKEARRLSNEIHKISVETDLKNDYRLKDQIRAAIGSVMDNIAEGFERNGNGEFRQFLSIAKGSAGETRSQLYRIFDCGYIDEVRFSHLKSELEQLSGKIKNFISYLNRSSFLGNKFRSRNQPGTSDLKPET
ncbi:four helix bundle protein [Niabella drilacis]|uniref:Four helix bundle protein n=1 Tax=Niabella drilacis (strain DSM 25811 / CCM 8410 / CCUG 62505 / LMG 26954 / E90) TaxID=1285928 RepID=A0A1G6W8Y8_NIADE|nr:four helix bundle protein [Niabella drilacis]SDD62274.1 four helix bundle protein [Niabella drilacis]